MPPQLSLSLSYAVAYSTTFEDFLQRASAAGFHSVQLIPDQQPNLYTDFGTARITSLRQQLTAQGMACSIHNVFYDINITSVIPAVRNLAFSVTQKVLRLADQLGAESLTLHPGYMFPGWRRDPTQADHFWRVAEQAMQRLGRLARSHGIPVLLENGSYHLTTRTGQGRTPLHLGIEPAELLRLVQAGQGPLLVSLDLNKAIHSGVALTEFVRLLSPFVRELQASTVRQRHPEITPLLQALLASGFNGSLVLEGQMSDIPADRDFLLEITRHTTRPIT